MVPDYGHEKTNEPIVFPATLSSIFFIRCSLFVIRESKTEKSVPDPVPLTFKCKHMAYAAWQTNYRKEVDRLSSDIGNELENLSGILLYRRIVFILYHLFCDEF